ncbi:hypothetical protein [Aeromonas caviae]|uniref:hypothetical protein n=1 Tax=Aeromonas caviae TaxID=648 RepID=UPI0025B6F71E|nr:hypothetical protein [Aeromonas caviae]
MGKQMDQDKLKALAAELAKDIKSEKDLGTLTQQLIKLTVETALNAEMDEHLANSTSKCDTRLCRLTVLFEYLDRLPESETFPRS